MELTVGSVLEGKVKSITNFGAFIALPENKTLGSLLDPFFGTFWHILAVSCGYLLFPLKKFSNSQKICLHLGKNGLQ